MPKPTLQNYGRSTVSEFLGDSIVYRNLEPMHPDLPGLPEIRKPLGLPPHRVPRKSEPDYARVITYLLKTAGDAAGGSPLHRLIYVGDTRLNDGQAFANLCRASGWDGLAFIGAEGKDPAAVQIQSDGPGMLYLANRWGMLDDFDRYAIEYHHPIDEHTAVIVDLDKTAVGARGRNDHVINAARVEAVRRTVGELLGDNFDVRAFERAYDTLNQTAYHPFTTDNQDYLAYICLILSSDLMDLTSLVAAIESKKLETFGDFLKTVEARSAALPADLRQLHAQIYDRVRAGDPTPFKAFRYNEYLTTIERFGSAGDEMPPDERLDREIVITQEVRDLALRWKSRGALLFGLSDKPDEASVPTPTLAAEGRPPIHAAVTHVVGRKAS